MTLACKYVDEVIIGAPFILTADLINSLNISHVIYIPTVDDMVLKEYKHIDPFAVAKEKDILITLEEDPEELTI
jgi:ethanolamine-phosphate cytidylyltransferase